MDNKIDLNDLLREKRELDSFLSTIAKDESSASIPVKETVQTKESSSPSVLENKSVLTDSDREAAGLTIEKPGIMPEDLFKPTAGKDKPHAQSIKAFIPGKDDVVPLKSAGIGRKDVFEEKASSTISFDKDKKTDFMPRVTSAKSVKPLESLKTMTRFDGTTKAETPFMTETTPPSLPEEKKPSVESGADVKKDSTTSAYDFEPEKKGGGKGKWAADGRAGAIDRAEPWGGWGGELVENGRIVAVKRPRGRPPKHPRPVVVVDEVPIPPHLVA